MEYKIKISGDIVSIKLGGQIYTEKYDDKTVSLYDALKMLSKKIESDYKELQRIGGLLNALE